MDAAMLSDLARFILAASLKGTVLVVLVLAVQLALGKWLPANWRYLLWFTVVVGLVTPFGFDAAVLPDAGAQAATPARAMPAPGAGPGTPARTAPSSFSPPAADTRVETPRTTETLPRPGPALLPYLWLAGVFAVCGAIALSSRRFARIVRHARPAPEALRELLRDCMRQAACSSPLTLLQSTDVDAPMIAGQFRPVLLLPANLERQLTQAQLRHVFIHELMHLQRGDIVGNWLVAMVQALHWFNPVVWYAFWRMRQDRELACDAATLQRLVPAERAGYGHTLLRLNDLPSGSRVPALAVGMLHARSHLHRRIVMLAAASRRSALHSAIATLVFVPLAALAFSQPTAKSPGAGEQAALASTRPAPMRAVPQAAATEPVADVVEAQASAAPAAFTAPASETDTLPVPTAPPAPAARPAPAGPPDARPVPALADQPAPSTDTFTAPPATMLVAAVPPAPAAMPAVAPAEALEDIAQLSEAIADAKGASIAFIEKWEAIASQCAARKGRFLGALSASCQRIRTAQRRGEVFGFAFACYQLNAWHEQLLETYRPAPEGELAAALEANARELATFCSKDTYASEYPAFAAMITDAEALKYFPRRNVTAANIELVRSEAYAALYRYDLSFNNANSMAIGASIGNVWGVQETTSMGTTYGVPVPASGGDAGMGSDGSNGGGAPSAP